MKRIFVDLIKLRILRGNPLGLSRKGLTLITSVLMEDRRRHREGERHYKVETDESDAATSLATSTAARSWERRGGILSCSFQREHSAASDWGTF